MTCQSSELIAAYVLGALEPAERDLVRRHIPVCAECRAALAQIAPLPALLARVPTEDAAAGPPVPDEAMLGRLLAAASETRQVRRRRVLAAAA
ncbi:MAG TPA: zf-HC2 domain-containing protein, partial [Sporichthya sp.]|nr:zf-HC2 domain-containing protein [Sporichthya sp.]